MNRLLIHNIGLLATPEGTAAKAGEEQGKIRALKDAWVLCEDGLVKEIRANPAWASMRVVVATADVEYRGKFAEMGFDDLLLKPITVEKLAKVVSGRAQP